MKALFLLIPFFIFLNAAGQGTVNVTAGSRGGNFAVTAGGGYHFKNAEALFELRTGSPFTRSAAYLGLSGGRTWGLRWAGERNDFGSVKPYAGLYRRLYGRQAKQDRYVHNGMTEVLSENPNIDGWAPGGGVQITYGLLLLDFNYTEQFSVTVGLKLLKKRTS